MHRLHCHSPAEFQKPNNIPFYPYKKSRVKDRGPILSPESGRDVVGDSGQKGKDERIRDGRESVRLSCRPECVDDADGGGTAGPNCFA